ncbi:MAG TPA: hypothetical protein VMB03_19740 [Bryobacteraceae bacterium]|nr:hypothetical protein [Bryobacteraceae bacterium]
MRDWAFAQTHPSRQLAPVHMFSVRKAKEPTMHFLAQTDNQKTAPDRPTGWGNTLLEALSECERAIQHFPYEGEETRAAGTL